VTLQNTVCDDCNQSFGNTIDLYLARDTPDGFRRFVLGYRPPDEYKSLGKASTMTYRLTEGSWAGAFVEQSPVEIVPRVDESKLALPAPARDERRRYPRRVHRLTPRAFPGQNSFCASFARTCFSVPAAAAASCSLSSQRRRS
jgi:hypothetical protein